jgi:hypothetical protein
MLCKVFMRRLSARRSSPGFGFAVDQRGGGGRWPAPPGPPAGRAASTPFVVWQVPVSVSPLRPVKLTVAPSALPLHAAMAPGGGPGGVPLAGGAGGSAVVDVAAAVAKPMSAALHAAMTGAMKRMLSMVVRLVMGVDE